MEHPDKKAYFLRNNYIPTLTSLNAEAERKWGKMNVQQMIEHMSDSFRQANGRDPQDCVTPADDVPKWQAFIESEKQFRENTPNALMGELPEPERYDSIGESIIELEDEINHFFRVFEKSPDRKICNPFFGELGYELWVKLLYKHAWHHLRQFGIEER